MLRTTILLSAEESDGAIHLFNAIGAIISLCDFVNNTAITGNGAGIRISSSRSTVAGNIFNNNRAPRGSVIIFWQASTMSEPPNVTTVNSYLSSNVVLYENFVATEITSLVLDSDNSYVVTDYTGPVPKLTIYATDYYG